MNIAIYPRKSKKDDNSESMEQQIDDCRKYINKTYPDANIIVYSGDYAITGHSTAKRKDFQRMMDDVRAGRINAVVIMRYDRIARNMRDFCNLYHDMESAGCNLISVSQQIDTSTPYGKNWQN
jgi:site-specific DNA recombinase